MMVAKTLVPAADASGFELERVQVVPAGAPTIAHCTGTHISRVAGDHTQPLIHAVGAAARDNEWICRSLQGSGQCEVMRYIWSVVRDRDGICNRAVGRNIRVVRRNYGADEKIGIGERVIDGQRVSEILVSRGRNSRV